MSSNNSEASVKGLSNDWLNLSFKNGSEMFQIIWQPSKIRRGLWLIHIFKILYIKVRASLYLSWLELLVAKYLSVSLLFYLIISY